jgi:hypothetical protein
MKAQRNHGPRSLANLRARQERLGFLLDWLMEAAESEDSRRLAGLIGGGFPVSSL